MTKTTVLIEASGCWASCHPVPLYTHLSSPGKSRNRTSPFWTDFTSTRAVIVWSQRYSERERTLMGAKGLFGLGALAFWLPEIALYTWQRQALNAKLVTFLLPSTFLLVYLLVSMLRPRRIPKPSAAIFMVLGVVFLGTLAMTIGATILGAGFREDPVSTLLAVLLGTAIPIYAFIGATYDGSLYALIFVSILMPLVHLVFERQNWIIPPKKTQNI